MKALVVLAERVPSITLPPPAAPAVKGGPRLVEAGMPKPGHQIMWHGQTRLTSAALGHEIGREVGFRDGQRHALPGVE